MEEIKINEYIRTSYGEIGQYIGVDTKFEMYDYDVNGNRSSCNYNELVKHSPNIIDLIEVGDWAIMNCYGLIIKKVITQDDIWELKTKEYQLLKILTKERFNSESYEV